MKLSIVTTIYYSSHQIEEFCSRACKIASSIFGDDYELILVNDCSPDNSLELAVDISKKNQNISIINLSRNFGHHKALMTGLSYASGEFVFLIDSDLEEEPERLKEFYEELIANKVDVVFGVQEQRKGGFFERISGAAFYKIFNYMSKINLVENAATIRLMRKHYVQALVQYSEKDIFIFGLFELVGYKQRPVKIIKLSSSKSTYTLRKKISLMASAVSSFSYFPLKFMFYLGSLIFTLASIYILYVFVMWSAGYSKVDGWASLIVSLWFLGGLTIACLGIVGIYLGKVLLEVKQRPFTIVRSFFKNGEERMNLRD